MSNRWLALPMIVCAALLAACGGPRSKQVLTVSPPRTVATLPTMAGGGAAWSMEWLDQDALILQLHFRPGASGRSSVSGSTLGLSLGGIAQVDLRTGRATVVHWPRPEGDGPRTTYSWSKLTDDGTAASVQLPPIEVGSGGAFGFAATAVSPANGLIAYLAGVRQPPAPGRAGGRMLDTGPWVSQADGSQAHRLKPWIAPPVAWSPDGKTLLFRVDADKPGPGLYVCRPDGSGLRKLAGLGAHWGTISPDSRQVAYRQGGTSAQRTIRVTSISGGRSRLVAKDAHSPTWIDGSILFLSDKPGVLPWAPPQAGGDVGRRLEIFDPATGERGQLLKARTNWGFFALRAPLLGRSVFTLSEWERPHASRYVHCVYALTADGLQRVPLKVSELRSLAWSPDGKQLAYIERGAIRVVEVEVKTVKRR